MSMLSIISMALYAEFGPQNGSHGFLCSWLPHANLAELGKAASLLACIRLDSVWRYATRTVPDPRIGFQSSTL